MLSAVCEVTEPVSAAVSKPNSYHIKLVAVMQVSMVAAVQMMLIFIVTGGTVSLLARHPLVGNFYYIVVCCARHPVNRLDQQMSYNTHCCGILRES
jgi:hypothetical protein